MNGCFPRPMQGSRVLAACLLFAALSGCAKRPAPQPPGSQQASDWYRRQNLFTTFDPDARDLSLVNAYLLELACYIGDKGTFEVDKTLAAWGFDRRRDFRDIQSSIYGYVASNERMVLVTFGGTDFMNARDLLSDVDALQLVRDDRYGATADARVHRGFRDSLNSVIDGVVDEVKAQARPASAAGTSTTAPTSRPAAKRLFIAGHSRGGAFAVLAAAAVAKVRAAAPDSLPPVGAVYTFGQPRVGNGPFVDGLASLGVPLFRFINRDDPVPTVPPAGLLPEGLGVGNRLNERLGYQHGGVAVQIRADGKLVRIGSNGPGSTALSDPLEATSSINNHYQPGYYTALYAALARPELIDDAEWRAAVTPGRVSALPRPGQ